MGHVGRIRRLMVGFLRESGDDVPAIASDGVIGGGSGDALIILSRVAVKILDCRVDMSIVLG